ncbi:MAG: DUF3293 domain-containing protein [Gemmatimonadales bacterium]
MTEKRKPLDERWSRYPETVLIFAGDPEVFVDLREEVPPQMKKALAAIGLGETFSVLTVFNPRGEDVGAAENSRRMADFEAELTSSGKSFVRVDACAPDKSHCECSVALSGSRDRAIDIAKRWEQIAIFWWDGSAFWIHGAISDAEPVRLPVA